MISWRGRGAEEEETACGSYQERRQRSTQRAEHVVFTLPCFNAPHDARGDAAVHPRGERRTNPGLNPRVCAGGGEVELCIRGSYPRGAGGKSTPHSFNIRYAIIPVQVQQRDAVNKTPL